MTDIDFEKLNEIVEKDEKDVKIEKNECCLVVKEEYVKNVKISSKNIFYDRE